MQEPGQERLGRADAPLRAAFGTIAAEISEAPKEAFPDVDGRHFVVASAGVYALTATASVDV
jgi:hypothetical protein